MKFEQPVPVTSIAQMIGARITGKEDAFVSGINELHKVEPGDLAFVDHPRYFDRCIQSAATCIIINQESNIPEGKTLLLVEDPFEAYLKIVRHYRPFLPSLQLISDSAVVGEGSVVMPGSYIGNHVVIGKDCIIHPHVTIMDHCSIGDRVVIQAGTVIGSDAFYYNRKVSRPVHYKRMESCGRVVIEDDVEIGAGCTIDRGVSHDTVISLGSKLDNLIHIGHDTVIGKNCLIAANVVVGGCTTIKDNVTIWGGVIINKTITIGENAVLFARTGVPNSLEGNKSYYGAPAQEARAAQKELVWIKRIPQLWEKVMGIKKS